MTPDPAVRPAVLERLVERVRCRTCGAGPLGPCTDVGATAVRRVAFHQSRRDDAVATFATPDADGWLPIESAPRDASWFEGRNGSGEVFRCHYACDASGEHQPAFAGFFREGAHAFVEVRPLRWRPEGAAAAATTTP